MIDWKRVTVLRDEIGDEDFAEVIDIFIEEVSETVQRLRTNPQIETLGDDLHALKGSALSLGFTTFAELCQIGETSAANGNADQIVLTPIFNCYDASKDALLNGLQNVPKSA